MCGLTKQQPFRLASEHQRYDEKHRGDTERSEPIEPWCVELHRCRDSRSGDDQPQERGSVLEQHRERGGILAAAEGIQKALPALAGTKCLEPEPPRDRFEHESRAEHDVIYECVADRLRMQDVLHALE